VYFVDKRKVNRLANRLFKKYGEALKARVINDKLNDEMDLLDINCPDNYHENTDRFPF
jgi:hypothetical protein